MNDIVFNDYANWLIENADFFENLKETKSILFTRNKHIFDVVAYLYDLKVEEKTIDEEQEYIFEVGFYYLFDQFEHINLLLKHTYNDDFDAFNKQAKTIVLLLNTIEFENDIHNLVSQKEAKKAFAEIEQEILKYLEKKEEAPQELFDKLNEVSEKIYNKHNLEYYPIFEIFYDIAIELNLL